MTWKLRVYSGLNAGAEVSLMPGRVVIGTDPAQADLVLADAGIAAIHLVLMVEAGGVRLLEWGASEAPTQDGREVAAQAELQALATQCCGPLQWAFCNQDDMFAEWPPAQRPRSGLRHGWFMVPGAGLLLLLVLLTRLLIADAEAQDTPTAVVAPVGQASQPQEQARTRLAQLLREWRLEDTLSVTDQGHTLVLRGALRERQLQDYQNLQRQYREAFGDHPSLRLVDEGRAPAPSKLDFPVRGVSLGRLPYVTLSDNRRYPVGALMPSGIRILAIDRQAITLSKGGRNYLINLKERPADDG
ncbi:type III secretion system inner membrane ring subunit SctD [Pseudomonas sp. BW13M1]|uniref:Type III secretion system inner membrane ring subunit SctD n=1 Tax=Pseudomonas peradeniyensis TaxID=2745488 RepID=A0A923GCF9_9PSED|nr:type III secretion system inner membrane ring subunit SctD [Pseudomonas peradeniyensis]MBV4507929.1 type III secretion system inner membrane ring subunit SctD [Pseudomonas peradeniyensis]